MFPGNVKGMDQRPFLLRLTKAIAKFIGSWWGVFAHTLWFAFWLMLDFSVERLSFWVSLEAIFIGIFLLMAANQAEIERDRMEARDRSREMQNVKEDLELDRREEHELREIKEMLAAVQRDLNELKGKLKNQNG